MAQKGALNLESESLLEIYNLVKEYETVVQDALYEQYKEAYKISLTNYMRGKAADSFKTYFSRGTINMIQGLLDISSEMTVTPMWEIKYSLLGRTYIRRTMKRYNQQRSFL